MSKKHWVLDAGHGGMDPNREYVTAPSKMYEHPDGTKIYEGVENRLIRAEIVRQATESYPDLHYSFASHGYEDTPLYQRVNKANELHLQLQNCVFVSIHLNAGKGKGYEVYTSVGETSSDKIADIWIEKMGIVAPGQIDRGEKDRDFQVLRDTMCPAILTESGFMDTLKDCKWIQSEEGRSAIAKAHLDMMIEVDNHPEL